MALWAPAIDRRVGLASLGADGHRCRSATHILAARFRGGNRLTSHRAGELASSCVQFLAPSFTSFYRFGVWDGTRWRAHDHPNACTPPTGPDPHYRLGFRTHWACFRCQPGRDTPALAAVCTNEHTVLFMPPQSQACKDPRQPLLTCSPHTPPTPTQAQPATTMRSRPC